MIEIIPNWHPFVVHFAIGLLMVSVVLFLLARLLDHLPSTTNMTIVARWNLWLGTGFAVLSALTGLQAYGTVEHDSAGHAAMHIHRLWAFITLGLFLLASLLAVIERQRDKGAGLPLLLVLLVGFGAVAVTGYLGAENVYRHGIGVERLPDPDDHRHEQGATSGKHDHEHETGHEHSNVHSPHSRMHESGSDQEEGSIDGHEH